MKNEAEASNEVGIFLEELDMYADGVFGNRPRCSVLRDVDEVEALKTAFMKRYDEIKASLNGGLS